jgi:glycosyltransferase involved in cell wall biosynthesis
MTNQAREGTSRAQDEDSLSIVMCVHRNHEHLAEAIRSVLNQTYGHFEFLICANACTDDLMTALLDICGPDKRVKIMRTAVPQLAFNLNHVAGLASGDWLVRMDADDVCEPNRLERLLYAIRTTQADVIGSWATMIDEAGQVRGMLRPPCTAREIRRRMLWSNPICHPSVAFKRSMWLEMRGYLGGFVSEDFDLWLRAILSGKVIVNVPESLLRYRIHAAQVSRSRLGYAETAAHWYRELLAKPSAYVLAGWLLASAKSIVSPLLARRIRP